MSTKVFESTDGNINLEFTQGDDKTYELEFEDSDGDVIDITGYTIYFTVKENIDQVDGSAVIQKTITSHSDPTNGESAITLTNSDTDVTPGNYIFDIRIKNASNEVKTVLQKGNLTIKKPTTQTIA